MARARVPKWFETHYDSPGRDVRRRTLLERVVEETLAYPAISKRAQLGAPVAEILAFTARTVAQAPQLQLDDDDSMTEAAVSAAESARRSLDRFGGDSCALAERCLSDFLTRLQTWRCKDCKRSSSCRGNRTLPHSTQRDGLEFPPSCLQPFVHDVEQARAFVLETYAPILNGAGKDFRAHADLVFAVQPDGRTKIDGTTTPRDLAHLMRQPPAQGLKRSVRVLFMMPANVNPITSFALIYVAAHELGVHAMERLDDTRAPRGDTRYPGFAEGLVDKAIFEALNRWLAGRGLSPLYHEGAEDRHSYHLLDPRYGADGAAHAQISFGREAYRQLLSLAEAARRHRLIRLLGAETWTLRVVLALNTLRYDEDQRDRIILTLRDIGGFCRLPDDLGPRARVVIGENGEVTETLASRLFSALDGLRVDPRSATRQAQVSAVFDL